MSAKKAKSKIQPEYAYLLAAAAATAVQHICMQYILPAVAAWLMLQDTILYFTQLGVYLIVFGPLALGAVAGLLLLNKLGQGRRLRFWFAGLLLAASTGYMVLATAAQNLVLILVIYAIYLMAFLAARELAARLKVNDALYVLAVLAAVVLIVLLGYEFNQMRLPDTIL